ncbi:MarR family transcriptional regulator [Halomicroarcula limicola]|uniref:MarR family transcriptional regulator n=1 Tax=Haloarcula limicola TaxID=1429915 RepID=A0A8J8C9H4_9EURY|nr:MarR family transcriptional regulator [Halomicroarcula limicola]MBV0925480.1 MarR family transcriptional regulator [Halomicroarcula limicola]
MTSDTIEDGRLADASNVLVLAPLTPAGNSAFLELITATSAPAETNVVAITYTQPPDTWIEDWKSQIGELPGALAFTHANGAEVTNEIESSSVSDDTSITVSKVDPREPMDIIAPVTESLTRWRNNDRQTVVSVQTLTLLLEYVDFDTAFRYLHILTHRVQNDAIGFYQMDPEVHDVETINTLKPLFDAVVEFEDGEWRVAETFAESERASTDSHAQRHDTSETEAEPESGDQGVLGAISGVLERFSGFGGSGDATASTADEPTEPTEATETAETSGPETAAEPDTPSEAVDGGASTDTAGDDSAGAEPGPDPGPESDSVSDADVTEPETSESEIEQIPDEAMMTDEDLICQLLTKYGGRMKQTDVTEETTWSKSTVSRKLSAMEEKGVITRVQVGRGNLVFLAGYEPESAKSPFLQEKSD